jgi:hypothetical protein
MSKNCTGCKITKNLTEFNKNKSSADGLSYKCKACKAEIDAKYRETHKESIRAKDKIYCAINSEKKKERAKIWYSENKERSKESKRIWNGKNAEYIRAHKRKYNDANRDWLNKYMNEYQKNRYQTNIAYRLRQLCNSRIRACLRKKTKSTIEYIGCTTEFLKAWIESQFYDDMSWDNMRTWHIDHVKPCASFNFDEESDIYECFHWSNLRPLYAKENIAKRDKLDNDLIEKQKVLAQNFLNSYDVPSET